MILRYATNLELAEELYDSSRPKLQGSQEMIDTFKGVFGLPERSARLAGTVGATAAALFAASSLNKNISRLGPITTFGILGVAAYEHSKAGHGKESTQHALDLLGLATLSFTDTFGKN